MDFTSPIYGWYRAGNDIRQIIRRIYGFLSSPLDYSFSNSSGVPLITIGVQNIGYVFFSPSVDDIARGKRISTGVFFHSHEQRFVFLETTASTGRIQMRRR